MNDPIFAIEPNPRLAPDTAEGRHLQRVCTELHRLWLAGQAQRCLTNLPLLAELLRNAGLLLEALVAELDWCLEATTERFPRLALCLAHPRRIYAPTWRICNIHRHRNEHRFLWFPPGTIDLVAVRNSDETYTGLYLWSYENIADRSFREEYVQKGHSDNQIHPTLGYLSLFTTILSEKPCNQSS